MLRAHVPALLEVRLDRRVTDLAAAPLRIVVILVLALLLRSLLHRAVKRLVARMTAGALPSLLLPLREKAPPRLAEAAPVAVERRRQRAETLGSVLRSAISVVVLGTAAATALSELGIDLRPILASAGIVGVAVGFGAQNLVRDFLAGFFLLLEDQFGVGDVIDAGPAEGEVEAVGLRSTRLRSIDGTVWHIRNGEIVRVGNRSQGWARAVLDVPVPKGTDVARAGARLLAVARELRAEPEWQAVLLADPELWGVESMGSDGVVVRVVAKTLPLEQWRVARELRQRFAAAVEEGLDKPLPRRRGARA